MMNAIITYAIKFQNATDVAAYKQLSFASLPEADREFNEVTDYKVGYKRILLIGANGRALASFDRQSVKGFAIDGQPIVLDGPNFKRIGCDPHDSELISERATYEVDAAIADGYSYRVLWVGFNGKVYHTDFKDSQEAENEYDTRLKTERAVRIIGLNN
jgi:hypothetical protein